MNGSGEGEKVLVGAAETVGERVWVGACVAVGLKLTNGDPGTGESVTVGLLVV